MRKNIGRQAIYAKIIVKSETIQRKIKVTK